MRGIKSIELISSPSATRPIIPLYVLLYLASNNSRLAFRSGAKAETTSSGYVFSSSLYFGELGPRDVSVPQQVTITNQGAWDLLVTADVTDNAEDLFVEGLNLDGSIWSSYEVTILRDGLRDTDAILTVPEDYTGTSAVEGALIFWATEAP